MDLRVLRRAEMVGRHHPPQRRREGATRIGQESGDTRQCLLLLGVEHMQDGADQQGVAGLFPMVPAFKRALGIDQDIGDVLDVAHLVRPLAHLQQWIIAGRAWVGRVEQQAV